MENLIQTQEQIFSAIEQMHVNFKKDSQDRKTPEYLARKLDTLDRYWSEFQKNHDKLCEFDDKNHVYFLENQYESTRSILDEVRAAICNYRPSTSFNRPPPLDEPRKTNPEGRPLTPTPRQKVSSQGSMSKLDEMLRKQISNFKAFSRTASNINLANIVEKWEFEDALKTLETRWAAIDTLHWEIDSELDGSDPNYEINFTRRENQYISLKKEINSKLWSVAHREKSTPQLEIPVFHGNYQQWLSFKDLFTEAIHNNPSLSHAQKMQFLKGKIKGEPERLIQHLPISTDNYITCWEILNHRYNNKKLIFTTHVNTMMNLPVVQQASTSQIKRLHDVTIECLNGIKNLGVCTSTWDPILVHILTQKLDAETHNEYMASLKQPRELPSLKDFLEFVEGKFTALESSRRKQEVTGPKPNMNTSSPSGNQTKSNRFNHYSSNKATTSKFSHTKQRICPVCDGDHGIYFCKDFKDMAAGVKHKIITKLNLCSNCLYNHHGQQCKSSKTCQECNEFHNTLLHECYSKQNRVTTAIANEYNVKKPAKQENGSHVARREDEPTILLATAIVNVQGADGQKHAMRALIDQGSQISLITENAAQRLGLPRQRCKGVITGVGANDTTCKGLVNVTCSSLTESYTFNVDVIILKSLTRNLPSTTFAQPPWDILKTIPMADSQFYISRPIDMLLGAEVLANIIMKGIHKHESSPLITQETRLGWILCGKVQSHQCNVVMQDMDGIQKFWEVEDIPEASSEFEEDECIKFYKATTKRLQDGRYQVRIPIMSTNLNELGQTKQKAIAQFRHLERKLAKNALIAKQYKLFIHEYLELGHMKPATNTDNPECYLPHHCVIREDSSTTALRVVYNASSKSSNGTSLNDLMHKGPNLQKDLLSLILKWRQHRIAFISDVEKMFRQIWVHEDDQALQKIIWRDDHHQGLQEYQLTTVTYGFKAAPFLAMMTFKQLASDERSNYPEAARALEECFYMDDLLHGADDEDSTKQLQQDLKSLLKAGGFNLRKWMSNYPGLLEIESKVDSAQNNYNFREPESRKTLGLLWDPTQDTFHFQSKIEATRQDPIYITKRQLLSDISKLFDPMGWLTPISTKLKIIFQNVWKANLQWDDKIPENIYTEWVKVKEDMKNINCLQIPRWLGTNANQEIELHAYCDASTRAYAGVIYCKINNNGQPKITLLVAKSRLVPHSKMVSLPKLELLGACLVAQLMEKVKKCLNNHNIKIYGWIDSTAVLGWLQGDPIRWKPFVANRVRQIAESMPVDCWRYVKSMENPADCASRGLTASQLEHHPLWWQGPSWLPSFCVENQVPEPKYSTNEEIKKLKQVNLVINTETSNSIIKDMLNKYSSFAKLIRVLAWLRRFIITKKEDGKKESFLTLPELKQAKILVIKNVQETAFEEDITDLKKKQHISAKSKILQLNPFLDENGLLRVGGRLNHAHISADMKHPIILPQEDRLTELIIDHAHKLSLHGGARLTLSFIRQKYWVIGGNSVIKKHIRRCVTCRKQNPAKLHQLMGDLPAARSNPSRPFFHTGVDYTGQVVVKANRGRGSKTTKGYVAVFVCMVTKAVHLELVSDMTTSAFIAALRRMAARKGTPAHIYSDNGRNFVGASRTLQKEYSDIENTMKVEFLPEISDLEITWHFIAPSWGSGGGLWESCVKSFKFHLKRVLGEQKLTYEEFTTLLAQIESCLNTRPLCSISEDPEDIGFLTPAHFLTGGPSLTIIETERDLRTRWQLTQKLVQDLWKRWRTEYLAKLTTRSKWQQAQCNIKLNDVVIIHEDNLPPGKWAMGRVIKLHPGQDGYVRVVSLKTKSGIIKRPIIKLSILTEYNENQSPSPNTQSQIKQPNEETKNRRATRNKANKAKVSFSSIVAALMLFLTFISGTECDEMVTSFRGNQSLYFDKLSDMMLIRDEWKLVVYYNMNPYWQATSAYFKYIEFLAKTCVSIQDQMHCDVLILQLRHGYSELQHYNQALLSQHTSMRQTVERRRRRGLVDGIGYIANSLFGVLDERFAEQYRKDINLLRNNDKHIVSLWRNQTSIIEAEFNLLKRTENTINKQHKILNQHMNKVEAALNELKGKVQVNVILNDFNMGAIIASNMLNKLKDLQNTLLDTITNIYQGHLNFHLLTPEQLTNELNIISSKLPRDESLPIENIHLELRKIYELLNVKTRMMEDVLIFEIRLPLISRDSYEILKIIPIPKKLGRTVTKILPVSDYIAINMKKDAFIIMTENDIRSCSILSEVYFCLIKKPVYHIQGDKSFCAMESSECKTITTPCRNEWLESYTLNTYIYFCCEWCQVRAMCGDQVTAHQLTSAGLINVGNGCIIKTEDFTIFPHKPHRSEIKIESDLYFQPIAPINHIINLTIPHLSLGNETQDVQREMLHVEKDIKALKDVEATEESISFHDIHHYTMIYVILWAIVIAGMILALRRVKCKWTVTSRTAAAAAAERAGDAPEPGPRCASRAAETTGQTNSSHSENDSRVDRATSPTFRLVSTA